MNCGTNPSNTPPNVFFPTITDPMNCVTAGSIIYRHSTLKYVTIAENARVMKRYRRGPGPSGIIPKTIQTRHEKGVDEVSIPKSRLFEH